jgi:hypothetical protein
MASSRSVWRFRSLNFFAGCVRQPIRQMCGIEAWMVIFRVLRDTTHTLMPGCEFSSTSVQVNADGDEQSDGGDSLEVLSSVEPSGSLAKQPPSAPSSRASTGEMDINVISPTGSFEKTFSSSSSRRTNASVSFHLSGGLLLIVFLAFLSQWQS